MLLKVVQSALDKAPLFVALAVGIFIVIFPDVVIGLLDTLMSVPVVPVSSPTLVTVPPASVTVKVIVSVVSSVVIAIPEPTKVKVSLLLSATIVSWPVTAKFLKIHCEEPKSVFVTSIVSVPLTLIPVPAVTLSTLLLKSDQSVDDNLPVAVALAIGMFISIVPFVVIGLPVTETSEPVSVELTAILVTVPVQSVFESNVLQSVDVSLPVFVALATGKLKTKFPFVVIGLLSIVKSFPDSVVVAPIDVTVPVQSVDVVPKVMESEFSSVVMVIFEPATKETESLLLSATILHWPVTNIVWKKHWVDPLSVLVILKLPSVVWFKVNVALPVNPSDAVIWISQSLADWLVLLIVTWLVDWFVVISMLAPSTNENPSLLHDAVRVFWPLTDMFLNIFWDEPLSLLVKLKELSKFWFKVKTALPFKPSEAETCIWQLLANGVEDDIVSVLPVIEVVKSPLPNITKESLFVDAVKPPVLAETFFIMLWLEPLSVLNKVTTPESPPPPRPSPAQTLVISPNGGTFVKLQKSK